MTEPETKTADDLKEKKEEPTQDPPDKKEEKPEKTPIESLPEDIQGYIKDLRKEAKDNRTSVTSYKAEVATLTKKVEDATKSLEKGTKKLEKFEDAEKEAKLAEASEVERLQIELEEATKKLTEAQNQVNLKDAEVLTLKSEQTKSSITSVVDSVVNAAGYQFKPYQRQGLLGEVLKADADGNYMPEEKIKSLVEEFIEENKESPSAPPGGGGKVKTSQIPAMNRLKELVALSKKRTLTGEEYSELNDLYAKAREAQQSAA